MAGMCNYYICDMRNQNILDKKSGTGEAGNGKPAGPASPNLQAAALRNTKLGDAELRKKVEARTVYLNSIKLKLS